ncbi:MAG: hypothetical protein ACT4QC_06890 [Planctomycetaceae bacterium]
MLNISKPSLIQNATGSSDLQSVTYFLGGNTGPFPMLAPNPGLARMAGDQLLMSQADQQGNTSVMAAQTRILAPEVVGLQLQYFDGSVWRSDWDCDVLQGIPTAVEVAIELETRENRPAAGDKTKTGTVIYRLVVALPGGKPLATTN